MKKRLLAPLGGVLVLALFLVAGCGASADGARIDQSRLSAEEIASVDVPNLFEVVQRLRPRWLEVRAPRSAFGGPPTEVVVFLERTLLGGVDELRRLGVETAASMEYVPGARAQATLAGIGTRHVEGAIIIYTK